MKQKFVMIVGLPGSGKSTKAQEICGRYTAIGTPCAIFSSDKIREELFGDVNDQEHNSDVFDTLNRRAIEALRNGTTVIYDATNLNYRRRKDFLGRINDIDCDKVCEFMAVPFKMCCQRNDERDRSVPRDVMERMYEGIHIPYYYEGWDEIKVEYPDNWFDEADSALSFMWNHMDYDQDNPHHTLTLGKHLRETWIWVDKWLEENPNVYDHDEAVALRVAAALHDCGKPFTKTLKSKNGTITAHYYNHQNVGAYDCLFYKSTINQLDVAVLIQWHMMPYQWGENGEEKYRKLWGNRLFEKIVLLNKADNLAK